LVSKIGNFQNYTFGGVPLVSRTVIFQKQLFRHPPSFRHPYQGTTAASGEILGGRVSGNGHPTPGAVGFKGKNWATVAKRDFGLPRLLAGW